MHCDMIKFNTYSGGGIIFYTGDTERFIKKIVEKELWLSHFEHGIVSAEAIIEVFIPEEDLQKLYFHDEDNLRFYYYGGDCC